MEGREGRGEAEAVVSKTLTVGCDSSTIAC